MEAESWAGWFGSRGPYVICAFKLSNEHTVVDGVDMEDTIEEGAKVGFGLLDLHAIDHVLEDMRGVTGKCSWIRVCQQLPGNEFTYCP